MSKIPLSYFKLFLVLALQGLGYWLFSFNIEFFEDQFPIRFAGVGVYFAIIAIHSIAIGVTALLLCVPIVYIYKEYSTIISFAIFTPALIPRITALFESSGSKFHPFVLTLSIYDGVLYAILLPLLTAWIGKYRLRIRTKIKAEESQPPIHA